MIHLSQSDARWSKVTLGQSQFTIGKYGCTTTCISMLSDYFQCFQPPDRIAKEFAKYTSDGLILWNTISLSHMAFETRGLGNNIDFIQNALKDPSRGVILNVNGGAHWVVAVRKAVFGDSFWALDPWDGKMRIAKNVVGYASFKLK